MGAYGTLLWALFVTIVFVWSPSRIISENVGGLTNAQGDAWYTKYGCAAFLGMLVEMTATLAVEPIFILNGIQGKYGNPSWARVALIFFLASLVYMIGTYVIRRSTNMPKYPRLSWPLTIATMVVFSPTTLYVWYVFFYQIHFVH